MTIHGNIWQYTDIHGNYMVACSAGGFWWGEWIYISIGCSGRHLDIVESWGEVKNLPSVGERKKNWGRGRGRGRGKKNPFSFPFPAPHPSAGCATGHMMCSNLLDVKPVIIILLIIIIVQ